MYWAAGELNRDRYNMAESTDEKAIISRVQQLRRQYSGERGKALFAKALGINPSTYSYYEKDRVPPAGLLCAMAKVTGTDLRWLLTGASGSKEGAAAALPQELVEKLSALLERRPECAGALVAFVDLLGQQPVAVEQSGEGAADGPTDDCEDDNSERPWLPILGRTAAGMVYFWGESTGALPAVTELAELIERHSRSACCRQVVEVDANGPPGALGSSAEMPGGEVRLVQLAEPGADGICEFVESRDIYDLHRDAFGLRVDGDSMAPRICDGDIVILSPAVAARDGSGAVVKLSGQIGVTCKIFRRDGDSIHLIPANESFETQVYGCEQVEWALAVLWRVRL